MKTILPIKVNRGLDRSRRGIRLHDVSPTYSTIGEPVDNSVKPSLRTGTSPIPLQPAGRYGSTLFGEQ